MIQPCSSCMLNLHSFLNFIVQTCWNLLCSHWDRIVFCMCFNVVEFCLLQSCCLPSLRKAWPLLCIAAAVYTQAGLGSRVAHAVVVQHLHGLIQASSWTVSTCHRGEFWCATHGFNKRLLLHGMRYSWLQQVDVAVFLNPWNAIQSLRGHARSSATCGVMSRCCHACSCPCCAAFWSMHFDSMQGMKCFWLAIRVVTRREWISTVALTDKNSMDCHLQTVIFIGSTWILRLWSDGWWTQEEVGGLVAGGRVRCPDDEHAVLLWTFAAAWAHVESTVALPVDRCAWVQQRRSWTLTRSRGQVSPRLLRARLRRVLVQENLFGGGPQQCFWAKDAAVQRAVGPRCQPAVPYTCMCVALFLSCGHWKV